MLDTSEALQGAETQQPEVHSQTGTYDGSRTSPDVQYEVMRRHKMGMTISAIADETHCDHRTVKAVIQNWGTAPHRLRLEAHRSQVIDNLILGMKEAAERGKLDSILSLSDRLGITEQPKGNQGPQVAVQVNLHGGPEPVSLAKVTLQSEGLIEQASNQVGLITSLMDTTQPVATQAVSEPSLPQHQPTDARSSEGRE
jgi:hypothetical protein